ncbi:MAG: hypothetical protein BGO98_13050 [Myxococcales bacterium 68-20]|nr:MAG: hypothetical protein BGO98_13050 [Myxococcales bacterium 68-20]
MKRVLVAGTLALSGVVSIACGSAGDSTFNDGSNTDGQGANGPNGGSGELPEIGPSGTSSACVTEVAGAELAPTNLVFVYDKSGSMGDVATGYDPAKRWLPVGSGLKQFFADPYSKTLRASLQFFPLSDDTIDTACAHPYASPVVPLSPASDPAFIAAIDSMKPSGGTPTLPALAGGITHAKEIASARPGEKTAVVLVTDGEPGFWDPSKNAYTPGCANNDVAHVAAAARQAFEGTPSIPTYVIGVGPKLESLQAVATAGGTGAAVMVDVNDPASTKSTIVSALDAIRRRELSCDFSLPPPPPGETLDPYAVNVAITGASGERVLGYSKECASPDGWHYDDISNPQRILLCSAACTAARETNGKVSIAFGCKTKLDVH